MSFYIYKIEYYDDIYERNKVRYGVVFSDSYVNAVKQLMSWYDDKETSTLKINKMAESNVLELDKEVTSKIIEGQY